MILTNLKAKKCLIETGTLCMSICRLLWKGTTEHDAASQVLLNSEILQIKNRVVANANPITGNQQRGIRSFSCDTWLGWHIVCEGKSQPVID